MTIERDAVGGCTPICDTCGAELPTEADFPAALQAIRGAGWKSGRSEDGDWEHTCRACLNGGTEPDE